MSEIATKTITVLIPVDETAVPPGKLAPRVPDLRGLRLGLLDNGKPNADLLLDQIQARLSEQCGTVAVVRRRKTRVGLDMDCLDELATQSDVIINGVAD